MLPMFFLQGPLWRQGPGPRSPLPLLWPWSHFALSGCLSCAFRFPTMQALPRVRDFPGTGLVPPLPPASHPLSHALPPYAPASRQRHLNPQLTLGVASRTVSQTPSRDSGLCSVPPQSPFPFCDLVLPFSCAPPPPTRIHCPTTGDTLARSAGTGGQPSPAEYVVAAAS